MKYQKKYHDGFSDDEDSLEKDKYMENGGGKNLDAGSNNSSDEDMEAMKK